MTDYGFTWGPIEIERTAEILRDGGLYRVLTVKTDSKEITIYVSPAGRSVRVFQNGKELK